MILVPSLLDNDTKFNRMQSKVSKLCSLTSLISPLLCRSGCQIGSVDINNVRKYSVALKVTSVVDQSLLNILLFLHLLLIFHLKSDESLTNLFTVTGHRPDYTFVLSGLV